MLFRSLVTEEVVLVDLDLLLRRFAEAADVVGERLVLLGAEELEHVRVALLVELLARRRLAVLDLHDDVAVVGVDRLGSDVVRLALERELHDRLGRLAGDRRDGIAAAVERARGEELRADRILVGRERLGRGRGAGVAVGEGTSDISIGSDPGGSIRIPAALNGVVGFKPTARRVPLAGAFPLSATLDSVGPLARSVADCAAADAVMAGDDHYAPSPRSLAGLRVAIPRGLLFDGTEPEVMAAFEHALAGMEGAGARLADITIDDLIAQMRAATKRGSIAAMEGAEVHADWLAEGAPVPVDPRVSEPLSRAATIPTPFYIRAMRRRVELARAMNGRFEAVDILALPASPVLAPTISALKADDALCDRVEGLMLRNTQVANQFDLCAISLPVPGTALPVGLMLVARHGHDRHLFDIAAGVEALLRR